jgi:gamma-glutamylcysteine synthetase
LRIQVFDKLEPVSKALFAAALSPLTDCDLDARICKDLDRRFCDETGSEKEGFLGRIAQLGLDGSNKRSHIRSPEAGSLN